MRYFCAEPVQRLTAWRIDVVVHEALEVAVGYSRGGNFELVLRIADATYV